MTQRNDNITPYLPDYTELADIDDGSWSDNDIGKAVKFDGYAVTLCAEDDEIYGFLKSRSPAQSGADVVFGVNGRTGHEQYIADVAGDLAVGDFVVSGDQAAIGSAVVASTGTPVKKGPALLTDNSGGTAADTIAAIGATYDQDEVRNAVASLAAKIALAQGNRRGWIVIDVQGSGANRQALVRKV